VAVPVLLARWHHAQQTAHLELLSAAVALGGFCALLFQVKALLVFDPSQPPPKLLVRALRAGADHLRFDVSRLPSRTARAYIISGIGVLWVGLGGALLLATEFLTDRLSLSVYYALAAGCITCGAFTTHGLAGFLRHSGPEAAAAAAAAQGVAAQGERGTAPSGWRFFQPFHGGTAFVLAQVDARRCRALAGEQNCLDGEARQDCVCCPHQSQPLHPCCCRRWAGRCTLQPWWPFCGCCGKPWLALRTGELVVPLVHALPFNCVALRPC
jgi:hypothetical protein